MDIVTPLMTAFWKTTEKKDNKRIASQTPPEGVRVISDVPYLNDGSRAHLLDVYYPEDTAAPLPVIIDIHGGGWMYGYKEINKHYCMMLAKSGYTVFSINYRLVPDVTVREQMRDIMDAFVYINSVLDDYPCDRNNLFLTGDSAGGQLAAYATVLNKNKALQEIFVTHGSDLTFNAVILTSPVAFIKEKKSLISFGLSPVYGADAKYSPIKNYFNFNEIIADVEDFPPCMLITSSGDYIAREQTRRLYRILKDKGFEAILFDWDKFNKTNLPHVFAVTDPFSEAGRKCLLDTVDFIKQHMH